MVKFLMIFLGLFAAACPQTSHGRELALLMRACAPQVHPTTLAAIVRGESLGRAYAISDDGPAHLPWSARKTMLRSFRPASKAEAIQIAEYLVQHGHMVGIGLTQISHRNLKRFGISVSDALDPCTNLKYGAHVLMEYYASARRRYTREQDALLAAVSAYNTNSFTAGFSNGYVAKVVNASLYSIPAIDRGGARTVVLRTKPVAPKKISARVPNARHSRLIAAKHSALEVQGD